MTITTALARAQHVLKSNKYFALATIDSNGPWVATLAYTVLKPHFLCFFSQATSRHGAAIANGSLIAGVIYDSTCTPADAESLQFSGRGEIAHDRATINEVLRVSAGTSGDAPPTEAAVEDALQNTSTLLYRVSVEDAYVLDQHLFSTEGIDGRQRIDRVDAIFND